VESIPLILLSQGGDLADSGTCLFFNGMEGTKEEALPGAARDGSDVAPWIVSALLNAGYNVALVDAPAHGERRRPGEDTEDLLIADLQSSAPVLLGRSRETARALVDGLLREGVVVARLAAVGQSWGALQALLTLAGDGRVACGALIMPVVAATDLEPFAPYADSPGARLGAVGLDDAAALAPRPLLFVSGGADLIARADRVDGLLELLRTSYGPEGDLRHVDIPGLGHEFDAGQVDELVSWLSARL